MERYSTMDIPKEWIAAIGVAISVAFGAVWRALHRNYLRLESEKEALVANQDAMQAEMKAEQIAVRDRMLADQKESHEKTLELSEKVAHLAGVKEMAQKVLDIVDKK